MTGDYQASLDYLFSRLNYERVGMPRSSSDLRLGRMRRLLRLLGDPHDALRIVHLAGTKGKGSTAAMIASALTAARIRTGLFCSPHLHRLEERFTIDGRMPGPEVVVALTDAVRPAVAEVDAFHHSRGLRELTFFEITTAMGLLHFARQQAGAVVLEVGLGGRLDSTNAVRPAVSVLTSISYDHTRQLGSTLRAIATEKAGILKRGRPAVSGVRGDDANAPIAWLAKERRVALRQIDHDFRYAYRPPAAPLARPVTGQARVTTWRTDWDWIDMPMLGEHQAHNAAVALATLDVLAEQGVNVSRDAVVHGISGLRWPARVELMGESPWLVIDGAHNVASAEALVETLKTCFPRTARTLVFGTTREKDLVGQLRVLLPLFDMVIATRYVENPRSVPPQEVAAAIESLGGTCSAIAADPADALATARRLTSPLALVCVTGSLFLAAEVRALVLGEDPAAGSRSLACTSV